MSNTNNSEERQSSQFQFPNSQRVYIEQGRADLRVPMREISLNVTRGMNGATQENLPVRVYDTSGPWGDPQVKCSVHDGLPTLRRPRVIAPRDVEKYEGRKIEPQDDGYLTEGAKQYARAKDKGRFESFPGLRRQPLRARRGQAVRQ